MTYSPNLSSITACIVSLFMIAACSSSENTTVVTDAPTSSSQTDTPTETEATSGSFQQLAIGENQPIPTLDPLFVENASSIRAVQLAFEGLVRYDDNGDIIPAAAQDWTVSNNQKKYSFTLRSDLYYHDSDIFSNGQGRRVRAADVKEVFERMAQATVPDKAAQLFMDIKNFEPYFQEQRQVMMSSQRQLDGISGIKTPNDSTITFALTEPDQDFLNKLASPFAVIYPQEAITANGFNAVGTGPFRLSQKRSDSLYIFARFDNYYNADQISLNRIDVRTSKSNTGLFNALTQNEVHLIPELGPRQMAMAVTPSGDLKSLPNGNYTLYDDRNSLGYHLRYNPNADLPQEQVKNTLAVADKQSFFTDLPDSYIQLMWTLPQSGSTSTADSVSSTYSDNPFVRQFYSQLSQQLSDSDINFEMKKTRVPNRNISLYVDNYWPVQDVAMSTTPPNTMASIAVKPLGIARSEVENLNFNALPWWIDLRDATVQSTDNR